jgi:DNA/RNA-binding domain of Phe-tRNA-synthetase-like protein
MPDALDVSVAVDERIFAAHPGYIAAIVLAEGLGNGPSDDRSSALLEEAERELLARGLARAADDPHLAEWRAAFSRFGAKPKRYPCSAEALAARVLKGGSLPRINALVDLYNAISVRHLIPVGGEDLDRLEGPLRLTIADGSERFDGAEDEAPKPGEVVWRDDAGVTCRRWNWRQCARSRITTETSSALFILDALDPLTDDAVHAAADALTAALLELSPDATIHSRLLTDPDRHDGGTPC